MGGGLLKNEPVMRKRRRPIVDCYEAPGSFQPEFFLLEEDEDEDVEDLEDEGNGPWNYPWEYPLSRGEKHRRISWVYESYFNMAVSAKADSEKCDVAECYFDEFLLNPCA